MLLKENTIKVMEGSRRKFAHEEHRGHSRPSVRLINV